MSDKSYHKIAFLSDKALLSKIGEFVKHHRLQQNRSQSDVAKSASLSRSTLSLLERGEKINLSSLLQVLRVLDLLHIMEIFEIEEEISPIEYAKIQKKKRQRSRHSGNEDDTKEDLGW
tara:strand:- start:380132 stop:380485 length:354 start_codon:yes stop_codon:yes gene_type:complete